MCLLAEHPSCYACESPKTNMEHAPPKCFFPEETDEKGTYVFRRDLMKVPSCDRHNTEKSSDDVYALWHLAALDGVNDCGRMLRENLLRRMAARDWQKKGGALMHDYGMKFTRSIRVVRLRKLTLKGCSGFFDSALRPCFSFTRLRRSSCR